MIWTKLGEQQGLLQHYLQNFEGVHDSTLACIQQQVQSQSKYLETAMNFLSIFTKRALLVKRHVVFFPGPRTTSAARYLDVVLGRLCTSVHQSQIDLLKMIESRFPEKNLFTMKIISWTFLKSPTSIVRGSRVAGNSHCDSS